MNGTVRLGLAAKRFRAAVPLVVAALALFGLVPTPAAADGGAFVRVNQVGYDLHGPKRAYLMAPSAEAGATFSVKNASGTTVYSAAVGPIRARGARRIHSCTRSTSGRSRRRAGTGSR